MRLRSFGPKLLCAFLLLLLTPALSFAQTENSAAIDCSGATPGAFTSVEQAILNSPDHTTFTITGNCTENIVDIQHRNDLSFIATAPTTIQVSSPTQQVLIITHSQSITFSGPITITGGQGVLISDSNGILISQVTIQNSGSFGITSSNSQVQIFNGSVSGNTRTGVVTFGGTVELDGTIISNNGRLGVSAATTHLIITDGNDLPPVISNNGIAGIQLFNSSQGDFTDLQITNNAGSNFGLEVFTNSAVVMQGGVINGNSGIGANCGSTSHCEFLQTQINSNTGGGIQITTHSELDLDGGVQISGNSGPGVLIDQASAFASGGGNTISGNTGDALIVNALSTLNFVAPDTITATGNSLALNCNNGSLVTGDISIYKPKRCGTAFQAVPIH
ncbi:MAG TPA: right-handed parallel beta-helix repeat-containing protein [Candidatus Angelobacter sp.]|nr:right-handed parallel beta-helix repeat-containing protein [Candidatus Angelobacter sp.]